MSASTGRAPVAWVLNLDAEEELAAPRRYQPSARVIEVVARQTRRLLDEAAHGTSFLAPGDLVVDERTPPGAAHGLTGRAWCPTPRALALLERAGARVDGALPLEVLRRVNGRPFTAELRAGLEGPGFDKRVAHDLDQALALVARPAPLGWLVRRTFGAAGRGRRRLEAGRVAEADRAWLAAGLRRGPLVVEPWVQVLGELTVCGLVDGQGRVQVHDPGFQLTTRQGAWTRTDPADPTHLGREDDGLVLAACERVGDALGAAGYRGPFGVDAFRFRAEPGAPVRLNALSEINARLTMDRRPTPADALP